MKIGIISDTHGHEGAWVRACAEFFGGADLILHAGDVAYHGPRNPMKADYNPMGLFLLDTSDAADDRRRLHVGGPPTRH